VNICALCHNIKFGSFHLAFRQGSKACAKSTTGGIPHAERWHALQQSCGAATDGNRFFKSFELYAEARGKHLHSLRCTLNCSNNL